MQKKWLFLAVVFTGIIGSQYVASAQSNTRKANKMQSKEQPLACNSMAMSPAQRERYQAQKKRLRDAIKETKELPNGYAFRMASEPNLLVATAEFIEGERQCCSFYTFNLEIAPNNGAVWLRITGPKNTKEFIRDALTL